GLRHFQPGVGDDREGGDGIRRFLDVALPALVLLDAVDGDADDLRVALRPFLGKLRHRAELRRADRREVFRVREEDRPSVADPVMEPNQALVGLGGEIGTRIVDPQAHGSLLFGRWQSGYRWETYCVACRIASAILGARQIAGRGTEVLIKL